MNGACSSSNRGFLDSESSRLPSSTYELALSLGKAVLSSEFIAASEAIREHARGLT